MHNFKLPILSLFILLTLVSPALANKWLTASRNGDTIALTRFYYDEGAEETFKHLQDISTEARLHGHHKVLVWVNDVLFGTLGGTKWEDLGISSPGTYSDMEFSETGQNFGFEYSDPMEFSDDHMEISDATDSDGVD